MTFFGILLSVWDFISCSQCSLPQDYVSWWWGATFCYKMRLLLKKSWGPLKWYFTLMCCESTSGCSTAVMEKTHQRGAGEGGSECVRGDCTYKLFKLYEMHVVYTCLSIYIWRMNIFVLFIERSLLQKKKNVYKKGMKTSYELILRL